MTIYFPYYYKDFKCIADKCRHSCCVGWEIDVDDSTLMKYRAIEGAFGDEIRSHISDDGVICLSEGDRCPFLDEAGLCRIISKLGEGYISEICNQHPRFYHSAGGRIEGGIGAVCEEACRIILSSDDYNRFIPYTRDIDIPEDTGFDSLVHRDFIYSVLSTDGMSYSEKLCIIREKYCITDPATECEEWNKLLSELEYLDESRRGLLAIGRKNEREELDCYFERFFAYLVLRHVSPSESYDNLRARVGFCILLSEILENVISVREASFEEISEAVRIISEELEYSEENTSLLIFEFESKI